MVPTNPLRAPFSASEIEAAVEARVAERTRDLELRVRELSERERELRLLTEMGELLQSSLNSEEAYSVISLAAQIAFGELPIEASAENGPAEPVMSAGGALGLLTAAGDRLSVVAAWGALQPLQDSGASMPADDCHALRQGRLHFGPHPVSPDCPGCNHRDWSTGPSLCIPLLAQGEALGILFLTAHGRNGAASSLLKRWATFATTFSEHISLSLANLKLRADLQMLAFRDHLTGLLNRRYLEETLARELRRARRSHGSLGLLMFDLDHFKEFNDTLGHLAGDRLLAALGRFLEGHTRGGDVACRYGGDEFLLILPDAGPEAVRERAEQLRTGFRGLEAVREVADLQLTLSLGTACYPHNGATPTALIQAADNALYLAKRRGRNQVAAASGLAA